MLHSFQGLSQLLNALSNFLFYTLIGQWLLLKNECASYQYLAILTALAV